MERGSFLFVVVGLLAVACGGSDEIGSDAGLSDGVSGPTVVAGTPPPLRDGESTPEPGAEPRDESVSEVSIASTTPVEGGPEADSGVPIHDFSAVDPLIEEFIDTNGLNGAAFVVVHRDLGIVDERYWGAFDADRVSLIASSSKMVAASVLMALDDAGRLDIDAPIADVLPYAAGHPEITTAQLLSNSSGLPGLMATKKYPDYLCAFAHEGSLQECAEAILMSADDDGDVVEPDTRFDYGGVQWQIAGAVAEVASGMSWGELVDELLVQPCGLTQFAFNNPFSQFKTAGSSHPPGFDDNPDVLVATANPNIEGGAHSTTTDYAEVMLMHLRGGVCGDTRVLTQEAVDALHLDRIATAYDGHAGDRMTGYGMGWWVDRVTGKISDPGAFGSVPVLDLDDGYGLLLMTESSSGLAVPLARALGPLVDEAFAAASD